MRYEEPKMHISMFDDEDDILTASSISADDGPIFGLGDSASSSEDTSGSSSYSIDVKTFR